MTIEQFIHLLLCVTLFIETIVINLLTKKVEKLEHRTRFLLTITEILTNAFCEKNREEKKEEE